MNPLCNCRCACTTVAAGVSALLGVIAAFLQITGTITVTAPFLVVALAIAVGYLNMLVIAAALAGREARNACLCGRLTTVLAGILGTILFAVVLLAVGIVATSVVSAILVGLLAFFFALTLTATACLVRCLADCTAV